jgi:hypothetical protein
MDGELDSKLAEALLDLHQEHRASPMMRKDSRLVFRQR